MFHIIMITLFLIAVTAILGIVYYSASTFASTPISDSWLQPLPFTLDDIRQCEETKEQAKTRLENIEAQLAERFQIKGSIRSALVRMDINNELVEDELVADWHCAYSSYLDWLENP